MSQSPLQQQKPSLYSLGALPLPHCPLPHGVLSLAPEMGVQRTWHTSNTSQTMLNHGGWDHRELTSSCEQSIVWVHSPGQGPQAPWVPDCNIVQIHLFAFTSLLLCVCVHVFVFQGRGMAVWKTQQPVGGRRDDQMNYWLGGGSQKSTKLIHTQINRIHYHPARLLNYPSWTRTVSKFYIANSALNVFQRLASQHAFILQKNVGKGGSYHARNKSWFCCTWKCCITLADN